ncbi:MULTISPECIES: TIGR02530 family flagellar biosynthesis protein [Sporomusa]|uniref:Flagellar operon protein n=1 Tax=Sporomusa sphaeroides DSM 2875 TaxID=1337886 RepID=A0ABM9VXU2_9FIRM|nr:MULTISPECIES: TIGR02530 family flagellar biosynthesis protein [Sporomusa]MCM0760189.1 flagellar protein [Sporomusa sphaeroides DSM 2875]OLS58162.1 hypothetical protein SPSPH_16980 [Sporomusa sphaeroides DSM 2875]CVK17651.1 hypothetical protein SSPH_00285 [Sporomusa sphaeroides DSM 2875]
MSDNRIYQSYQPLPPIVPVSSSPKPARAAANQPAAGTSFNQILGQELAGVTFSKHALQRLDSRKIQLDSSQLNQLSQAIDKAAQKGAKESLIIMDNNLAFVVSVKNKTVITAVDGASGAGNVFTNIDSAVII